jgi:hypothetical protein
MKSKFIFTLVFGSILAMSTLFATMSDARADGWRHGPRPNHYHGGGYGWVAPLVLGGVVGYAIAQPRPVPPPVVYVNPQPVYGPYVPPYGYHWENVLDANCNCYRTVLVQN